MGSDSLYALDVRLSRLGKLPAAITGRPLIPWIWFRGLFILVLAAMTVAVVRNHLFEVQIVVRRWGLRLIALVAATAGVLVLWRLLVMPRTRPADWLVAAAGSTHRRPVRDNRPAQPSLAAAFVRCPC